MGRGAGLTATHTPGPHEIELANGAYLDLVQPDHSVITVEAIAHALSNTCRYGGSCLRFLSVAEHVVMVAGRLRQLGAPAHIVAAGLHHDDAEAVLGDIPRPLKPLIGPRYAELTRGVDRAIWRALAWPDRSRPPLWQTADFECLLLKDVDRWACAVEAAQVMPSAGAGWEHDRYGGVQAAGVEDWPVACWSPEQAAREFLIAHEALSNDNTRRT